MERVGCLIIGYFCGCFLTADILARQRTGKGMWEGRLGNPGMAGAAAHFGAKGGLLVLAGDLLKTALASVLCAALLPLPGRLEVLYGGLGALLGHNWPFWNGFHGGKGVAVSGAMSVFFSPAAGLVSFALGGLAVLASGYLAVGSAVIAVAYPVLVGLLVPGREALAIASLAGGMILWRHRGNFKRLLAGEEKKAAWLAKLRRR